LFAFKLDECLRMVGVLCQGQLTVVPRNTAVLAGTRLTLSCDTNSTTKVSWYFGRRQAIIFNGFSVSSEFRRHTVRRPKYHLQIRDVQPSDAGLYKCLHSKSHSATAEVIVLGKYILLTNIIDLSPNSTWPATSRLDTTRHIRITYIS